MSEIVWGADIPVDRKMPDWLDRDAEIRVKWAHNGVATAPAWTFTFPNGHWVSGQIASFRLPADHPHYKQSEVIAPEWAYQRVIDLQGLGGCWTAKMAASAMNGHMDTFTRYIAEHEDAPVDPDVLAVRAVMGAWFNMEEDYDGYQESRFRRALAAYKATKGGEG